MLLSSAPQIPPWAMDNSAPSAALVGEGMIAQSNPVAVALKSDLYVQQPNLRKPLPAI